MPKTGMVTNARSLWTPNLTDQNNGFGDQFCLEMVFPSMMFHDGSIRSLLVELVPTCGLKPIPQPLFHGWALALAFAFRLGTTPAALAAAFPLGTAFGAGFAISMTLFAVASASAHGTPWPQAVAAVSKIKVLFALAA